MAHKSWGSALIGVALLAAPPAFGDVLFDCAIGAKQLSVTLEGDAATYTFGPKGAPELTITAAPRDLTYLPWDGWGIEMPEAVQFQSAGITYEVWYSVRKQGDKDEHVAHVPAAGGVRVLKGLATISTLR